MYLEVIISVSTWRYQKCYCLMSLNIYSTNQPSEVNEVKKTEKNIIFFIKLINEIGLPAQDRLGCPIPTV